MSDVDLRSVLWGDSHLRTKRYLQILDEGALNEDIQKVLNYLSNYSPLGNRRDKRGASLRQLGYICTLADFDRALTREFGRVVSEGGGLDSGQAHTIITKLKDDRGAREQSKMTQEV